jgi:hypothetical protein
MEGVELMGAIKAGIIISDHYDGPASRLAALWNEIDFDNSIWQIPQAG